MLSNSIYSFKKYMQIRICTCHQTLSRLPGSNWHTLGHSWEFWSNRYLQPLTKSHPVSLSSLSAHLASKREFNLIFKACRFRVYYPIRGRRNRHGKSSYSWRNAFIFLVAWRDVIKSVLKVIIKESKYREKFYELEKALFFALPSQ